MLKVDNFRYYKNLYIFDWYFPQGRLNIKPNFGRGLIQEPLSRFLEKNDYQLEAGGDYQFLLRAKL